MNFRPGDIVRDDESKKRYYLVGPYGEDYYLGWVGIQAGAGSFGSIPRKIPLDLLQTFRLIGNCLD